MKPRGRLMALVLLGLVAASALWVRGRLATPPTGMLTVCPRPIVTFPAGVVEAPPPAIDLEAALAQAVREVEILDAHPGENPGDRIWGRIRVASLRSRMGDLALAESTYLDAIALEREFGFSGDSAQMMLVKFYVQQERFAEAEEICLHVLEDLEAALGEGSPAAIIPLGHLAKIQAEQGRLDESEATLRQIIRIGEENDRDAREGSAFSLGRACEQLEQRLRSRGEEGDADGIRRRCMRACFVPDPV